MKGFTIKTAGILMGVCLLAGMTRGAHVSIPANGEVVGGSPTHANFPPENAFDGDLTDAGRWLPEQSTLPGFVTWRFTDGNVYVIDEYRLMSQQHSMPARSPKDFELYGSNDGSTWVLVDSITDEPAFSANQWRTYAVDSPGAFEYYKFNVSAWFGTDTYGGLREIELYGEEGVLSAWSIPSVSDVTTTTAQASSVTAGALDEAKLLWDTEEKGTDDPADWTVGNLSLGAQSADATVTGQMTGLAADTLYTFRFYGEYDSTPDWSLPRTFASALSSAQTPAFTGTDSAMTVISLEWTDNAVTETGYVLRRAPSTAGPFDVIANLPANSTSYLDTGLDPNTTYVYQLAAVNSDNESQTAFADCQVSVTTQPAPAFRCQIGVLTLETLGGLNPATGEPWKVGDQYRIVFITSNSIDARVSNPLGDLNSIDTWNAIAQQFADNSNQPTLANATWKVIGSSTTVDARDNTSTNPAVDGSGHPIMLIDGATVVASNFNVLWGGNIEHVINMTENLGQTIGAAPAIPWPSTGTTASGTKHGSTGVLRNISGGGNIRQGEASTTQGWIDRANRTVAAQSSSPMPIYAMSEALTIQPPPATMIVIR